MGSGLSTYQPNSITWTYLCDYSNDTYQTTSIGYSGITLGDTLSTDTVKAYNNLRSTGVTLTGGTTYLSTGTV